MISRRGVGTAVFGGMLASAILGIFLIPVLYVVFQTLREKLKGASPAPGVAQPAAHGAASAGSERATS